MHRVQEQFLKVFTVSNLAGMSVLVTRASHQATRLCKLIEREGGEPICFPVTEITPLSAHEPVLQDGLAQIPTANVVVFLSPNAVLFGLALFESQGIRLPSRAEILAIGPGTKRQLESHCTVVSGVPLVLFNSEGLLQLPQLGDVTGRTVVLVQGEGGRTQVAEMLVERGAHVVYLPCYRRSRSSQVDHRVLERWRRQGIDVIVLTSASGADHLWEILDEEAKELLEKVTIATVSKRIRDHCRALGSRNRILVAQDASMEALVAIIGSQHKF